MFSDRFTHLKSSAQRTSLERAFETLILDAKARRLKPTTLDYFYWQLGPFLQFLEEQGIMTPQAIEPRHIRAYIVSLQERGLKDTSQHAAARAIRAFCNFLEREEIVELSPMRKVPMPRLDKRILPAFSQEDVKQLLAACQNVRDIAIIYFLVDTGCRATEFISLRVGDVDIHSGAVRVRLGKGGKDRVTFLGATARKALLKYMMQRGSMSDDDPLWISFTSGKGLTVAGLAMLCKRLSARSGVQHCSAHTFRRTCALWSLRAGMNIYVLQQIMGHADLTTLRRYLALVEDDLQEAHQRHGAVDNML
ncbi:MAG: tyrosine-type recombinase/integrase [Caldilineales bacterium]|nr:tyrosine-type recombinase/integrase [Caldilineales bacterium]